MRILAFKIYKKKKEGCDTGMRGKKWCSVLVDFHQTKLTEPNCLATSVRAFHSKKVLECCLFSRSIDYTTSSSV